MVAVGHRSTQCGRFLSSVYFPILQKGKVFFAIAWFLLFVLSIVFGFNFLSSTTVSQAAPPGAKRNSSAARRPQMHFFFVLRGACAFVCVRVPTGRHAV